MTEHADLTTLITSVAGAIAAVGGGIRMLLGYWFKQQKLIRDQDQRIKQLEFKELRDMMDNFSLKLKQFENKMDLIHGKLKNNTVAAERVVQAQIAFVASVERKLQMFENRFEDLGQVVVKK